MPNGGIGIGGEVMRASGLGEGARILHAALGVMGVPSWLIEAGIAVPGEQRNAAERTHVLDSLPPAAPLILCVNAPQMPLALLRMSRAHLRNRLIIGFWSWELPVLPGSWRAAVKLVHEIWVPSTFTSAAVATILPPVAAPILRTVPYPLAVAPPRPASIGRDAFGLPSDAVIILASFSLASSFVRKNPLGTIAAFRAAFGERADRVLVLKIGKSELYPEDLATIRAATGGVSNIRIETRTFSSAERHALTACADIVLSLHRSEGFGLVPAEAMLLGKPVVATGWSGNMTFMDSTSAALVGFRLVPVSDPRAVYSVPGAVWAEPDVADAAARLVQLAEDAPERIALGARGQAAARMRLGIEGLGNAVRAIGISPSLNAMS